MSKLSFKSVWAPHSATWNFQCPVCRSLNKVRGKPNPITFSFISQVTLLTAMIVLLGWRWFSWKGFVFFFIIWAIYESCCRLYARRHLLCRFCAYDPYIFLQDKQKGLDLIHQRLTKDLQRQGFEVVNNKVVKASDFAAPPS